MRDWKEWWKKAGIRALRTIAQSLAGTMPVGVPVTVAMIRNFDISVIYAILAWLATGMICGINSLLMSLAGLPELEDAAKPEITEYHYPDMGDDGK
ncbi:MAG: hypothetical protein J5643_07375 [Lachnospiraceae bacterium]|nr:hypothetical protein [Lachnospiraceae bacterium]